MSFSPSADPPSVEPRISNSVTAALARGINSARSVPVSEKNTYSVTSSQLERGPIEENQQGQYH